MSKILHQPITCGCKYYFDIKDGQMVLMSYVSKCEEHAIMDDESAFIAAIEKNKSYVQGVDDDSLSNPA